MIGCGPNSHSDVTKINYSIFTVVSACVLASRVLTDFGVGSRVKMAFCRRYSYAITGVLMAAGATTSAASHVREGKDVAYHDGNLRYRAAQPYDEGSCGFPQVHAPLN